MGFIQIGDFQEDFPGATTLNLVLIVGDDIGKEQFSLEGAGSNYPATPNINALATNGVRFTRFYVPPSCSPARACWFTGRYTDRNGIGTPIEARLGDGGVEIEEAAIYVSEITFPKLVKMAGLPHKTALIGKDHITTGSNNSGIEAPGRQGFDYWMGMRRNVNALSDGSTYYDWEKRSPTELFRCKVYNTTDITDEAVAWILERKALQEPYIVYVNYLAAHTPLGPLSNGPPISLYDEVTWGNPPSSAALNRKATIEALDTEIGRLMAAINLDDTTVFFVTDNGTESVALQAEVHPDKGSYNSSGWNGEQGKGTMYESGINVPMYVRGAAVFSPGTTDDHHWHAVDIFQTWGELLGIDPVAFLSDVTFPRRPKRVLDCVSFKEALDDATVTSPRTSLYFGSFSPQGINALTTLGVNPRRAVIHVNGAGTRYKLYAYGAYPEFSAATPGRRLFNLTALDAADEFELQGPTEADNPADLLLNTGDPSVLNATDRAAYDACLAVMAGLAASITANDLQFIPETATYP